MGKATITSNRGEGRYDIQIDIDHSRITALIASLTSKIATLETGIAGMKPDYGKETNVDAKEKINKLFLMEKETAKLKLNALNKEKYRLESIKNEPVTREAWCVDYSIGLSGQVGTIEVPGDMAFVNIKPGYISQAMHAKNDGIIGDAYTNGPAGTIYNLAMMPGWQKWKPTYRYAMITRVYEDRNKCDIILLDIPSSQQELSINKFSDYKQVDINYMGKSSESYCFVSGDTVVVAFTEQDWNKPVVIGFKKYPRQIYNDEFRPGLVTFDFTISSREGVNYDDFGLGRHYVYNNTGWIFDYEDPKNVGYCYTLPSTWDELSFFWRDAFGDQEGLNQYITNYNGKKLEPQWDSNGNELYAEISHQSITGYSCVGLGSGPLGWHGILFYPDTGGRETDRTGQHLDRQLSEMYSFTAGRDIEVWVYDYVNISGARFA